MIEGVSFFDSLSSYQYMSLVVFVCAHDFPWVTQSKSNSPKGAGLKGGLSRPACQK